MKALPKKGDRVVVTGVMEDEPDPIEPGTMGTVTGTSVSTVASQIFVDWDNGRTLILLADDPWELSLF